MLGNIDTKTQTQKHGITISVLIPNLGYSTFLFDCLNSIIYQKRCSCFNFEIIVCDQSDCDVHNKIKNEIIDKYGDSVTLIHSHIKGLFRARHTLMKYATGDYCFFCDSDDYVDSDYLSTLDNIINDEHFPDIILTYFKYCDKNGNDLEKQLDFSIFSADNFMDYFLFSSKLNNIWMKLFKRELYSLDDYEGLDWGVTNGEDFVFSYPLMKKAERISCHFDIRKYHYRMVQSSMTHRLNYELCKRSAGIKTKYINGVVLNDFQNQIRLNELTQRFSSDSQVMIRQKTITFNQFVEFVNIYNTIFCSEHLSLRKGMIIGTKHKFIYKMIRGNHNIVLWLLFWFFSRRLKRN